MLNFDLRPNGTNSLWQTHWDKDFERLFDTITKADSGTPACDIWDIEKAYVVSLDVPGMKKEDIDIEVKDNKLIISGERKDFAKEGEKNKILRSERRFGKFSRIFSLPQNIDTENIAARFENGVLEVALPKEEKAQPKKISISDWSEQRQIEGNSRPQ